jgi:hypothetical protein
MFEFGSQFKYVRPLLFTNHKKWKVLPKSFNKLDKNLEKLDFLPLFYNDMVYIEKPNMTADYNKALLALKTIRDLCKYKQVRMDWGHYVLDKIVELETPVEEKIVEVLEEVEND